MVSVMTRSFGGVKLSRSVKFTFIEGSNFS